MSKYPPFIYEPDRSIEVIDASGQYLEEHFELKERIANLGWCYQSIGKAVPQTMENLWSGHYFPFTESSDELQISFTLAMQGFYKQAFVSLRSGLELGMLSVYYNIDDEGHRVVRNWLKSKDGWESDTPRVKKIWKILKDNKNIERFDRKLNIKSCFDDLGWLHNYVHTKGFSFSNRLGVPKSNYQTFEENVFKKWVNTYETVVIIVVTLHMLKYPITSIKYDWGEKVGIDNPFPVLDEYEIQKIEELLPEGYIEEVREIAKQDAQTQELYQHIVNLPDMSEKVKEEQIINLDRSLIEYGQGFVEWEKQQIAILDSSKYIDKEKVLKRIDVLREWATENGFLDRAMERNKQESE